MSMDAAAVASSASAAARLDPAALQAALALVDGAATVRAGAALLRQQLAPLKVVVVDAFDMRGETPLASGERVLVWAGASDGHCWQVTSDLASASGLFLAAKD